MIKQNWVERAISTYNFHCKKVAADKDWGIRNTAYLLKRSTGSVAEDIQITQAIKTYGDRIKSFSCARDALVFIRNKRKGMMQEYKDI